MLDLPHPSAAQGDFVSGWDPRQPVEELARCSQHAPLLDDLAEKRCGQFGTCGESSANAKALAIANEGLEKILAEDCDGVADELDKFVVQMTIPVIQGMVRYLYLADPVINEGSCTDGVCTYDKEWAEAWAFAAAVLPQIDQCDSSVADLLVAQLDVDGDAPP